MDIKVGERIVDLDPRRHGRHGKVVRIFPHSVRIRWSTRVTTRISTAQLSRSRYLRLPMRLPVPRRPGDCVVGRDAFGHRVWRCWACKRRGRLRRPWRVLWWRPTHRGAQVGTVVCSDACQAEVTGGAHARR
ncbi:MAG: hypothetical protein K0V04_14375 [Deltaproteobacteria bacterium]|nr:hypothetical protein [Deltaproteobacteria bacterium]